MRKVLLVAFMLGLASPSFAQDTPSFDVAGGYSFLRNQALEENLHGWVGSVTGNLNSIFGITGEVGGNYKTLDAFGTDVSVSVHSFMVGPRFASRTSQTITPYFHALVGAVRGSVSVLGESESGTDFALQPGGGVDFWLQPNLGIRVGGDYRRIFAEDDGVNEFRFHFGIVLAGAAR